MNEHAHCWQLSNYEMGVSRGVCSAAGCGAVRYFTNDPTDAEYMKRVNELNKELGWQPFQREKYGNPSKEGTKMTQEQATATGRERPPIRPVTIGMNIRERNFAMSAYYEKNKTAIIADLQAVGELAMRKKWTITQATLKGLRRRWGLPPHEKRRKVKQQPVPVVKEGRATAEEKARLNSLIASVSGRSGGAAVQTGAAGKEIEKSVRGKVEAELKKRLSERTEAGPGDTVKAAIPPGIRVLVIPLSEGLPPLPQFESGWADAVKLKWLEIFEKLAAGAAQK